MACPSDLSASDEEEGLSGDDIEKGVKNMCDDLNLVDQRLSFQDWLGHPIIKKMLFDPLRDTNPETSEDFLQNEILKPLYDNSDRLRAMLVLVYYAACEGYGKRIADFLDDTSEDETDTKSAAKK